MNLFGLSIEGLPVTAFLSAMRLLFVVVTLIGVALATTRRQHPRLGRIVLVVGIAGHAIAWFATMFPLPSVYGANGSMDRENHLGWANVVAQGFSPLRTFQVDHLHFEPVWPLLTAVASGFNVGRVPLIFQWAPLVMGLALLFSVRFTWTAGLGRGEGRDIEAAFAALGALLLMAVPGDFAGPFRNPWALTFLLKPNHVLGLVLVPMAALAVSRASSWKSRLFAGFILQLVGWAFVIHMALFVAGLAIFVALSFVTKRSERRADLIDASVAVGVNLLIVSPYLAMLVVAYPFLQGHDAFRLSPFTELPFEGPLRAGLLLALSAYGASRAYAAGRFGRIMAAQWLAAHLVWQGLPILGLFGQAREQDEVFYWCRFWTGLFAGLGLFHAVQAVLIRLRARTPADHGHVNGVSVAISLTLLLPSLIPAWWDPSKMDQYFTAAREPMPAWIAEPTRFIRDKTPVDAVFAGDRVYARWIAAYGARRVLLANSLNAPVDHRRRIAFENALLRETPEPDAGLGRRYDIQYLLVTSIPLEQAPDLTLDQLMARPRLETVYDHQFQTRRVVIFKVLAAGGRR